MFERALIPVDIAPGHEPVLDLVTRVLAPGGHVTLVHVIELIAGLPRDDDPAFYRRLENSAVHHLTRYLERSASQGGRWTQAVLFGDRAAEVIRLARDSGADLIALRTHRIDPTDPATGWATLSHKIAALAPCPVLLVKGA